MYLVSELFREYAERIARTTNFKILALPPGAEEQELFTRQHFTQVSIDEAISSGDELEIGTCIAGQLKITFLEGINLPIGTELRPYVRFEDQDGSNPSEWLPLGVYYVDSKPSTRQVGDYTCLDKMAQAEQPYKTELTYPAPMQEVLIEALTQLGADTAYECVDDYTVVIEPVQYTIRDILGYVASAHGGCASFDRDGLFTVVELHKEPVYTIRRKSYNRQTVERDPFRVEQLDIVVTDDLTITRGEAEPYNTIQWVLPWATEEMADALFEQLGGLEYYDMVLDMDLGGLPWLEPGDMVLVEDDMDPENLFPIVIQRQQLHYDGGLSISIESFARSYNDGEFPRTSDLAKLVENKTKILQDAVYHIENASIQYLTDQLNGIIDIEFSALVQTNPLFNASLNLVITQPGVIEFSYSLDSVPHHVTPLHTVGVGNHIIHLFLPLINVKGNQGHNLQVFMRSDTARGYIQRQQLQAVVNGTGLAAVKPKKPEARIVEYVAATPMNVVEATAATIADEASVSVQTPIGDSLVEHVAPFLVSSEVSIATIVDEPFIDFPPQLLDIVNDGYNRIILTFDNPLADVDIIDNMDAFFLVATEDGIAKQYTKVDIYLDIDNRILYIEIDESESLANADDGQLEVRYRADLGNLRSAEEGGMFVDSFVYQMEVI